jgi:multiple sugar transport system permease protein
VAVTTRSEARRAPSRPPGAGNGRQRRPDDTKLALIFILPAVIGLAVFYFWPLVRGIWLSFTSWDLLSPERFVGLANYERMFADPVFWNAIWRTLEYVVLNIGIQTVVALVIALLMQRLTQSTLVRSLILAPYLVSNVVAALVFFWILDFQLGIGNQMLEWIGLDRIGFFTTEEWAIPTIALVNVWRHMGYTALLIFAGLVMIPRTLYEAARVDGAGEWQMFRRITLPLLRPAVALVLTLMVTGSLLAFDQFWILTRGGPDNSTTSLVMVIYREAFIRLDLGSAAAVSVVLLAGLVVLNVVQLGVLRRRANR